MFAMPWVAAHMLAAASRCLGMSFMRLLSLALFLGSIGAPLAGQGEARQEGIRKAGEALEAGRNSEALRHLNRLRGAKSDPAVSHMRAVAHSRLGVAKEEAGDLRGALRSFEAAARAKPDEPGLLLSLGSLQMRLGAKRTAEKRLRKVLALEPDNAQALAMLGQIAVGSDDSKQAGRLYRQASRAAPDRAGLGELANRLEREDEAEAGYETRRSGASILQFPNNKKVRAALPEIEKWLEGAHQDLQRILGATPRSPVTVVLYGGNEFKKVSHAQHWAKAYYDGKIRLNLDSSAALRSELRRTMRHELAHAYLHELYGTLPLWVHEGLAQIVEGRAPGSAGARFRSGEPLLGEELFLNGFASSADMKVVDKGYTQSLMAVGFLLGGRRDERFRLLLAEMGEGRGSEDALRAVYGMSLAGMLEAAKRNK